MRIASEYHNATRRILHGRRRCTRSARSVGTLVLASDGAAACVRIFALDATGQLTPAANGIVACAYGRHAFPAQIAIAPDGRTAYVADNLGDVVVAIDLASRAVLRSLAGRHFPLYVAAGGRDVVAAGTGLSSVRVAFLAGAGAAVRAAGFRSVEIIVADGMSSARRRDRRSRDRPDGSRTRRNAKSSAERRRVRRASPQRTISPTSRSPTSIASPSCRSTARRASCADSICGSIPARRTARSRAPRRSAPTESGSTSRLPGSMPSRFSTRSGRRDTATG